MLLAVAVALGVVGIQQPAMALEGTGCSPCEQRWTALGRVHSFVSACCEPTDGASDCYDATNFHGDEMGGGCSEHSQCSGGGGGGPTDPDPQ